MRGGEQLRQGGFDFVAEINVNAGGGVSFLFHAAEIKPRNGETGEKISCDSVCRFGNPDKTFSNGAKA